MRIVVLDGYCLNPGDISWAPFEKLGELTVYERTSLTDEEEIAGRIAGAEVVLTNKTPLTRAVLERCPHLRYIGVLATGYNVVDIEAARQRGIPVCNVPSYGTRAVAQFAIALLLELCHRVWTTAGACTTASGAPKSISAIGTPPSGNWRALSSAWWATAGSAGQRRALPGPSA